MFENAQFRMRFSDLETAIEDCKAGYYSEKEFAQKAQSIVQRMVNATDSEITYGKVEILN